MSTPLDQITIEEVINGPKSFILFFSSGSVKHTLLWEVIESQSNAYKVNVDKHKNLLEKINIRVTPIVCVFENGELIAFFNLRKLKELKEYVALG